MVMPTILGILLFILLIVILGWVFAATVLDIAINGVLLYLVVMRAWADLVKGRLKIYTITGFFALLVFFIKAKIFTFLWPITNFVVVWFLLAQAAILLSKMRKKKLL
jgi:hypothetical protein